MREGQGARRPWRRAGTWAGLALTALASAGADPQGGDIDWVPLVIFGVVVLCLFPLLLVCFGMRRRPPAEEDDGMERVSALEPARLPVDLAAVHERAPTSRPPRGPDEALAADAEPEVGIRADLPKPPPAGPERRRSIPPGGEAARCSKCRWAIMAGGTPRVWCPNCGADLRLVFDEARPDPPPGGPPLAL